MMYTILALGLYMYAGFLGSNGQDAQAMYWAIGAILTQLVQIESTIKEMTRPR